MGRTPAGRTRERVYRFLRERLLSGRPPTVREVQQGLGFRAVETARAHLARLVEEGRLVQERGKARGYRLPRSQGSFHLVPVLGNVQAGAFVTAVEDLEGYVAVDARGQGGEWFGLRVRGESMRDAGILPGDLVVVRRQSTARSGEIVVALVGDEATVKIFRRRGARAELRPANPAFKPIAVDARELRLLGRVVEVRRSL
ncbi:MAG: transcriptional repressor LexA [Planctomycetota bacterium]